MPFTLAHAAAALPFRRTRLIPSALLIGTFAPDLDYFLRLRPGGGFSHTLPGMFLLSLPLGLATLWLFHRAVKNPFVQLLPLRLQRRLPPYQGEFRFLGIRRFAMIVASMLLGIATHLVWDSFTHSNDWPYYHWTFLRHWVQVPFHHPMQICGVLQYLSSLAGCGILLLWLEQWYRNADPSHQPLCPVIPAAHRWAILLTVAIVAFAGGLARAAIANHRAAYPLSMGRMGDEAICAMIGLAWWQLVLYGVILSVRRSSKPEVPATL